MTTLYLVPTPLGDPDDITLRALRTLREVRVIAADDPQAVQVMMDHYQISTPIISHERAVEALSVGDAALVGRAGTPGIGDWAHEIVVEAIARGIRVEALPGASAEITALVLSGLPTEAFVYVGALPDDLSRCAHERETLIFATNDLAESTRKLRAALGDRRVCIARLTPSEWMYRGMLSEAAHDDHAEAGSDKILFVVEGAPEEIAETWDEARVRAALRERLKAGEPLKLAAKAVAAAAGWDRRTVYKLGVEMKKIR